MQKMSVFIDEETNNKLKELKIKSGKSLSRIASDFVKLGCFPIVNKEQLKQNIFDKNISSLESKHTEYLVKILHIILDVYRCTRNEKSRYPAATSDDAVKQISSIVTAYIQGFNESSDNKN